MLLKCSDYQTLESKDMRVIRQDESQDGVERQLLVMQTPFGYRRVAEIVSSTNGWTAMQRSYMFTGMSRTRLTSNRSQFEEEAKEMARSGAVCLLIETFGLTRIFS